MVSFAIKNVAALTITKNVVKLFYLVLFVVLGLKQNLITQSIAIIYVVEKFLVNSRKIEEAKEKTGIT